MQAIRCAAAWHLVIACSCVSAAGAVVQEAPQVSVHQASLIRNAETRLPNTASTPAAPVAGRATQNANVNVRADRKKELAGKASIVVTAGGVQRSKVLYALPHSTATLQQQQAQPPHVADSNSRIPVGTVQGSAITTDHAAVPPLPSWLIWLSSYSPRGAALLASLTLAGIVKFFCMAGNILVQISPYPQVKRWEKRGCTGEADAAPYMAIAFGGCQWCFYGIFAWIVTKRSGFLILVHSNCLGAILGSYYTFAFYRNCRNPGALNNVNRYISAATSLALLQVCTILSLPAERALFLTGLVASFCSFVGAMSMLVTVPMVIQTRDSQSICTPLVVANFVCAIFWVFCGWMLRDPLVTGPNVVAAVASGVCMWLKWQFPSELNTLDSDDDGVEGTNRKRTRWRIPNEINEATPLVVSEQPEVPSAEASMTEAPPLVPSGNTAVLSVGPPPSSSSSTRADEYEDDGLEEVCLDDGNLPCADGTGGTC